MSEWKPPAPFDAASRRAESARPPAALPDLLGLVAAVIGFFVFAGSVELSEKVVGWGSGYESWQLDEVPLSLLVLSIGLVWFAFRRVAEARREVAERVRAEARVAELLARNRELSQRLILTQENERRAMARELHDQIGQDCTAIRAEASYLIHAARGENEPVMASARRIAGISESLYAIVRDLLGRLRPPALDSLGLEQALQELCETWEKQSAIACGFFPQDVPAALDDTVGITVFRLVQEGLTNIARHSGADQVRIELRLQADGEQLLLSIADNGRGLPDADSPRPGFGLIGMAERVGGLHGTLRLISQPGQGLRIEARLPTTVAAA
jgi:two-component system, NarL family, sensor histidine kinase FusK